MYLYLTPETPEKNQLEIHFISVGQGDAVLIKLPDTKNMLIDAGSNKYSNKVINYIRHQGINQLDYVIATHPHEDHIGGLDRVISTFRIGKIFMPDVIHPTRSFEDVLTIIKKKKLRITPAKKDLVIINNK